MTILTLVLSSRRVTFQDLSTREPDEFDVLHAAARQLLGLADSLLTNLGAAADRCNAEEIARGGAAVTLLGVRTCR
eukprot:4063465-Pleurochrysis_carterae.AAC.2